ncbi:BACON domain-containing carbohydrate-binding protein [uncultured Bacteroides sp.]|uniref:BACON domain-containing protein n=1 Tax=uncultured Bacteroides sp. TaxID=162156 RepID=UPI0025D78BB6|nr:BACON domain-containing carbohydrate-binding protein [uncultured Bacteroides sp.]
MKHIFNYITVVLSLLLVSCGDNQIMESTLPAGFTTDALTKYEVPAEPGLDFSIAFTVEDPFNCSIKSDREWCKVVITWDNGIHARLEVEDNTTGKNRTANVIIASPKIKGEYVIEVKQLAAVFEFGNLSDELLPEGGRFPIYVAADCPWMLESDVDWIEFDVISGESTLETGPMEVNVTVKPNEDGIVRSASMTLRSSSGKERIFARQVWQCEPWNTQTRIGDANVQFDLNKLDDNYPQMQEWMKAGVTGGIPSLEVQLSKITKIFEAGTSAKEINDFILSGDKYAPRIILLKNGNYTFESQIRLYNQDVLIGESRDGVIVALTDKGGFSYYNADKAGIRNISIEGKYASTPPDPTIMEETLLGMGLAKHATIEMKGARNCYIDNVKMKNIASHAFVIGNTTQNDGKHNTIRDLDVDGSYNKGGYMGYLHIGGSYNLITGCHVIHLRHISMQDPTSFYNVFYKNDVEQEFSFHNDDGGNNLIEYNKITLPTTLGESYCAIMGPWSVQHKVGGKNFIYRNKCLELNRDNNTPWSDNELYVGPWEVKPADLYTNFRVVEDYPKPAGGTLYPVILK